MVVVVVRGNALAVARAAAGRLLVIADVEIRFVALELLVVVVVVQVLVHPRALLTRGHDREIVVIQRLRVVRLIRVLGVEVVHDLLREVDIVHLVLVVMDRLGRVLGLGVLGVVLRHGRVILGRLRVLDFVLADVRVFVGVQARGPRERVRGGRVVVRVERIVAEHQRVHRADRVRRDIPERRRHRAEEHEERQKAHHARTHRATPRHGQSRRARCRMRAPRACRGCSTDDEVLRFLKLSSSPGCRRAVLGS